MRITVDDLSNNPELQKRFEGVRIFLDGIEIRSVFVADQENGYIEKHMLDNDEKPMLNQYRNEVLTEKLFGKVEFIFRD